MKALIKCRCSLWPSRSCIFFVFIFRGEYGLEQYSEVKTVSDKFSSPPPMAFNHILFPGMYE